MIRALLVTGAVSGFLGVALGAFGAHGLRGRVTESLLAAFQTGVQYHLVHTLAVLLTALLAAQGLARPALGTAAGWLFIAGIVLFSGSLYLMAVTGVRWLGAITPLGGGAFLVGWVLLALAVLRPGP